MIAFAHRSPTIPAGWARDMPACNHRQLERDRCFGYPSDHHHAALRRPRATWRRMFSKRS